ncbi:hypothetical protein BC826DRAFT_68457 [Russula brevipes]|nr:hypothetical protein BC826DRAFT_68457 [Russula brevipes]
MILETPFQSDGASLHKPPPTGAELEDNPPAYSRGPRTNSPSPRTVSLSRNRQAAAPFSPPVNGLNMYTKREDIRGSWSLDPQAQQVPPHNLVQMLLDGSPEKKKKCRRSRSAKAMPPTAKFSSRHGSIRATLRVLGESALRSIATIRAESRKGNVVLDLVSISPMRTVHIDAYSRKGSVTLLVPRNFCGLVQLSSHHGAVEVLPVLAASGRVIRRRVKKLRSSWATAQCPTLVPKISPILLGSPLVMGGSG